MKRKFGVLVYFIAAIVLIVIFILFVVFYSLSPSRSGIKYKKSWICNEYDITFENDDQKFPYVPSENNGTIVVDDNCIDIIFRVGYGDFEVGNYGEKYIDECGIETRDFKVLFSGNYEYTSGHIIAIASDINDSKFRYLDSQKLIFTAK